MIATFVVESGLCAKGGGFWSEGSLFHSANWQSHLEKWLLCYLLVSYSVVCVIVSWYVFLYALHLVSRHWLELVIIFTYGHWKHLGNNKLQNFLRESKQDGLLTLQFLINGGRNSQGVLRWSLELSLIGGTNKVLNESLDVRSKSDNKIKIKNN